jgi:hypothetical protein
MKSKAESVEWFVQQEETPIIATFGDHPTGAIAKVYRNDKRAHKDAALISAAPELKESCELFVAFLASLNPGWLGKTTGDIGLLNDAYIKSARALKKANGGK